jgi:signal transduction histidine kinase
MDVAEKRFFAFIRDISERVRAEEALRIAHDELERRVEERTAELERANETLKKEIAERVEAQREIERSQQRESVLNALLRISMTELSLKEQLDQVLGEILSVPWLPVLRQGGIFLVGDDPGVLELRAQRGLPPELQVTCARVPFGQCICGRAAASGEIEFAARVDERHETIYEGMTPHGHYCVPILSGDRVTGAILLYLKEGHRRDAQEEEFLRAAAHTLGGIIERVRVEEALRRSEKELRALNEQLEDYSRNLEGRVAERTREIEQRRQVAESLRDILTVLNSDRPLDKILEYIVAEATRLLGSDTSAIYRLRADDEAFRVQTALGRFAESVSQADLPPGLSQTLRQGRPVAIPELTSAVGQVDDLSYPSDSGQGTPPARVVDYCRALLAVPLVVADELYGSLVLYYSGAREFTEEEIGLAVAFSDQAALAIENARLHQRARGAAVMEERARLARELHDSVTQSLYSLTLLAEGWRRLARAGRLEDTEDSLTELGDLAQQALKEMRLMVHELRPPALEEEGLLGALHHRLGAVERRSGVEARLVAEELIELPAAMEEELYRIAVEALNNALKHAAATSVSVRLRTDEERLELEVRDNGRGFDVARSDESQGMGLVNMRERAEKLGGSLVLHSAPGQGTRIVVSVPYTDPNERP